MRELFSFLVSERSFSRLSNLEEKAEIVEESCSILETRAATDWGDDGGARVPEKLWCLASVRSFQRASRLASSPTFPKICLAH